MRNHFSRQVKEIISFSREEALGLRNDFIGIEHLLLGLIRQPGNGAVQMLQSLHVDLSELRREVELAMKNKAGEDESSGLKVSTIRNFSTISLPLNRQAEKVVRQMVLEAKIFDCRIVETEHLLLAMLKDKENISAKILNQFKVDYNGAVTLLQNKLPVS